MTVKTIRGKGRGLFADRRYRTGQLVLRHEILPLPEQEAAAIEDSFLNAYVFFMGGITFLALGEASLLNHSSAPSLDYHFAKKTRQIEFYALRAIQKGEELSIDYDWDEYPWEES